MYTIILDTDFLLHCTEKRVDIFTEINRICNFQYKIFIIDKTLKELENKKNSKLVFQIIKDKADIIKTKMDKTVDELILDLELNNLMVCTSDRALKEKLKKRNIPVITLRQGKYLKVEYVL